MTRKMRATCAKGHSQKCLDFYLRSRPNVRGSWVMTQQKCQALWDGISNETRNEKNMEGDVEFYCSTFLRTPKNQHLCQSVDVKSLKTAFVMWRGRELNLGLSFLKKQLFLTPTKPGKSELFHELSRSELLAFKFDIFLRFLQSHLCYCLIQRLGSFPLKTARTWRAAHNESRSRPVHLSVRTFST